LITTDHEAAYDFYADLFGWEKTDAMDMGEMGTYQMYGQGEETYGGMFNKPEDMPAPPHWLLYVKVPDVEAAAAKVTELGGQVLNGPMDVPGGDQIVQCMDPQGGVFALHSAGAGQED
jgi:predicted enzyme related to lactoylglutathione lyase